MGFNPEDAGRPVDGRIVFAPEETVDVPLWDDDGPLPDDEEWLTTTLGLSVKLIDDLKSWATDWNTPPTGDMGTANGWYETIDQRRLAGRQMFERLRAELSPKFSVIDGFSRPENGSPTGL